MNSLFDTLAFKTIWIVIQPVHTIRDVCAFSFLLQAHIWHFGKCAYLVSCQESVKVTDASLLSVGLWWRVISQTNAVFGQVTTSLTKHWLNPKIKSSLCEINHYTLKWRHIWPIDQESGSTGDFFLLIYYLTKYIFGFFMIVLLALPTISFSFQIQFSL